MSNNNANPSVDPANTGTLVGTLRHTFTKMMQGIDGALPAKVIAFDRAKNIVQVQPMIAVLTTDNTAVARAQIASVPVVQMGGGGFVMNFNIRPGDLGWIIASDRDISLYLKYYTQSSPNTYRMKNFADSFFIPNILTNFTIADEDADNAVLQSLDGTVKVSLSTDTVKISAPKIEAVATISVHVTAPSINATATLINATASEAAAISAPQIDAIATGSIVLTAPDVTVNASDSLNLNVSGFSFSGSAPRVTIDSPVPVQINNSVYVDGEIIATGNIFANTPIPPL